jgi:hypothetical protein
MLVERLLEDLEAEIKAVRDAQRGLAASYENFWEEYQRELELKRQRQLEEEDRRRAQAARPAIGICLGAAVRSAQERMARPVVWARLSEVGIKPAHEGVDGNGVRARGGKFAARHAVGPTRIPEGGANGLRDAERDRVARHGVRCTGDGRDERLQRVVKPGRWLVRSEQVGRIFHMILPRAAVIYEQ